MKRIFFIMLALVLAVGLTLPAGVAATDTKTISVKQSTLDDHQPGCPYITSWHFIINQIEPPSARPPFITVYWDNGSSANVPLWKVTKGGVAHYTTTLNAGSKVVNATAVIYAGWLGEFNLSSIGCGGDEPLPPEAELTIIKFYDSNANGQWDLGELELSDWEISIDGDTYLTPFYAVVEPGTYLITESEGGAGWEATGITVVGTSAYNIISNTEVEVTLVDKDSVTVYFGNVKESLDVSKTAVTSYTRTHDWSIDKAVAPEEIWLYFDGSGDTTATWTIGVTYEGYEDSDFNVCGEVTIKNDGAIPVTITNVEDFLGEDKISVKVDFGVQFPYTIAAGATLTGTYCVPVDDKIPGHNLAIVYTERGGKYEAESEELDWDKPTTEVHRFVEVKDYSDIFGDRLLGTLDAHDYEAGDVETFTYEKLFKWAEYPSCGNYTYDNTAEVIGDRGALLDSASATLKVNVQCFTYRYETAYAKGDAAICFIPTFSNWGWTNPINPGTYEWPLWAGAGQCDTSKGTQVGTVTVTYSNGSVTVKYNLFPYHTLQETHVYAGTTMFPKVRVGRRLVDTVAPGQYYITSPLSGSIYVIAHAKVGIPVPDPNFGPP